MDKLVRLLVDENFDAIEQEWSTVLYNEPTITRMGIPIMYMKSGVGKVSPSAK